MKMTIKLVFALLIICIGVTSSCTHESEFNVNLNANDTIVLSYLPDTVIVQQGTVFKTDTPTITGAKPVNFALDISPAPFFGQVTIDTTGAISVDSLIAVGIYKVTVTTTNTIGPVIFKDALTIIVEGSPQAPTNLIYNPDSVTVARGQLFSSATPLISGTLPITYTIVSTPTNSKITINSSGVISVTDSIPLGSYTIDITATNSIGTTTFTNGYKITVTEPTPLSNLIYTPSTLILNDGTIGASAVPSINGTGPYTYAITTTPVNVNIIINAQGVISVNGTIPVGSYSIDVVATNSVGSVTFSNVYTIKIIPVLPSNLVYSPNSLNVLSGTVASSNAPAINGSTPMSYTLISSPQTTGLSINSNTGIITTTALPIGTYVISVTATNAAGSSSFSSVFTITVSSSSSAPSALAYSPNALTLSAGTVGASVVPSISGTTPITYALTTSPTSSSISIDVNTGVIKVSGTALTGTYVITVTATNSVGSTPFSNVYTITVASPIAPTNLMYIPASITVTAGTAITSATPTISGTSPITYSLSVSPFSSEITINSSTGVISISNAALANTYSISVTATNSAGTTPFNAAYTITVNPNLISYAANIRPLFVATCSGSTCHQPGSFQQNFQKYSVASADINNIITRINLPSTSGGFMPLGGAPLTAAQLALVQQWKTDGLQP